MMTQRFPLVPVRRTLRVLFGLVLLGALSGCGVFGGDETGIEPAELTEIQPQVQIESLWSFQVGDGNGEKYVQLVPATEGGLLYVADARGRVIAINRDTGARAWKADLDTRVSAGVGAGEGLVLVGTNDGTVYALESLTGAVRWQARVSSEILAPPRVGNGMVIVQSVDDNVHALDPASGDSLWVYDTEVPVLSLRGTSRPQVRGDLVIAAFANGKIAGLDGKNGQLLWEYRVGIPSGESELERMVDIDGDLLLSGDTVYAASYQGRVSAVHVSTGVSRWDRDASSYRGLGLGAQHLYMVNAEGIVEAMNRRTADVEWKQEGLLHRRLTSPVVVGDYVVLGDFEGYLHVLSYRDGAFLGRVRLDKSGIRSQPLLVDNVLYVMANDGDLAAYRIN